MRRIRTLGLGAIVALALMALPAGATAKGGLEADVYPVELVGESQSGSHLINLKGLGATYKCPIALSAELSGPATTISATSWWGGECTGFEAKGCKLEFHPGTENSFDVGPPGCGPMRFYVGSCKIGIPPQTGLGASFTNEGEGSKAKLAIDAASTLTYIRSGGICGPKEVTESGTIGGKWEVLGLDGSGELTGIRATDNFGGLFLSGSGEESVFDAENYPFPISGKQVLTKEFRFISPQLGDTITCDVTKLSGMASGASPELSLDAAYSKCKMNSGLASVTVGTNSCDHVFGVDASAPYTGTLDLSCGAKPLEIVLDSVLGKCVIGIPTQSFPAEYQNLGEGSSRSIVAAVEDKGTSYTLTQTGFGCLGAVGSYSDGTLVDWAIVEGA